MESFAVNPYAAVSAPLRPTALFQRGGATSLFGAYIPSYLSGLLHISPTQHRFFPFISQKNLLPRNERQHSIPHSLAPFIFRTTLVTAHHRLLTSARILLSLKDSLAIEVSHSCIPSFLTTAPGRRELLSSVNEAPFTCDLYPKQGSVVLVMRLRAKPCPSNANVTTRRDHNNQVQF